LQTGIQVSDTTLQEGQGMHGGFGRDQTWNNMAAIGPDFKKGYVDPDPVGNIDIVPTLAHLLGITLPSHGTLTGRVMTEALTGEAAPAAPPIKTLASPPTSSGRRTLLHYQEQNGTKYFDQACLISTEGTCP
jgi:arylsulfatase A-like enzyme